MNGHQELLVRRAARSFTLIETMIVAILIGILAAGSVAVFAVPQRILAIEKIESLLIEARNRTRSVNLSHEIIFDVFEQTIGLHEKDSPDWCIDKITGEELLFDVDSLSSGTLILQSPRLSAGSSIVFELDGTCTGYGEIPLIDSDSDIIEIQVTRLGHITR